MAKSKTERPTLEEAKKAMEKKYGKGAIIKGDEMEPVDDVVSTGSIGLDIATGIGGIPISKGGKNGKIIEIDGWESSGKSTLTQTIIGNAQKKGLTCLLVDGENSIDENYTPALGVDMDKLILIQLDEYAGEGAYDRMQTLIETGEIDLVVIDSYNALQPKQIVDEGLDKQTMGLHARMLGRVVMKSNSYCKTYGTTFIFIGQLREKIGVMWGSPETTQGGNALRFYAHMRMDISRSLTTDNSVMEGDEKVGNLHKVHIKKNKMAAPFKKAEFNIRYGVGIDKIQELIDLGHEIEVIKKRGDTIKYGEDKFSIAEFTDLLQTNEGFYDDIRSKILAQSKVKQLNNTFESKEDIIEQTNELVNELILEDESENKEII